jgi:hypothetical protein
VEKFGRPEWWIELFVVKWKHYEPGIFKIHYVGGRWFYDLLGIAEVKLWWDNR